MPKSLFDYMKRSAPKDDSSAKKAKIEENKENHQIPEVKKTEKSKEVCEVSTDQKNKYQKLVGESWYKVINEQFNKAYFKKLEKYLEKERRGSVKIFPPEREVFSWTKLCGFDEVKVVILGQDPYHQPNQAHGLCFSVLKGVRPPPSLVNIYKELKTDIDGFIIPNHGNLSGWARQGVLLLNAVLTVRNSQANAHKGQGWEQFTDAIIKYINDSRKEVVFLLWGGYAQKKGAKVNQRNHCVVKSTHPSPLGANKGGWFGSKPFSKANTYLTKHGKIPINWKDLPEE